MSAIARRAMARAAAREPSTRPTGIGSEETHSAHGSPGRELGGRALGIDHVHPDAGTQLDGRRDREPRQHLHVPVVAIIAGQRGIVDDVPQKLAVVEVDGEAAMPRYVRRPFQSEPDFGVTSVNYDLGELLARAEEPR